jgi:Fe2+ or Zn2+ uptake regulation protein
MIASLQRARHRATPQRTAVIWALVDATNHPSADQLSSAVAARRPGVGLATIYNTLDLLVELGEIVALEFGDGRKRYEVRPRQPHAHLICTACGRVEDVTGVNLLAGPTQEAQRRGFQIYEPRFDLRGVCATCQRQVCDRRADGWPVAVETEVNA